MAVRAGVVRVNGRVPPPAPATDEPPTPARNPLRVTQRRPMRRSPRHPNKRRWSERRHPPHLSRLCCLRFRRCRWGLMSRSSRSRMSSRRSPLATRIRAGCTATPPSRAGGRTSTARPGRRWASSWRSPPVILIRVGCAATPPLRVGEPTWPAKAKRLAAPTSPSPLAVRIRALCAATAPSRVGVLLPPTCEATTTRDPAGPVWSPRGRGRGRRGAFPARSTVLAHARGRACQRPGRVACWVRHFGWGCPCL